MRGRSGPARSLGRGIEERGRIDNGEAMRWVGTILLAVFFATLPTSALAARKPRPLPPVYTAPPAIPLVYALHGTLTHYVPATRLANGSITIQVDAATVNAGFALYGTFTFTVAPWTVVATDRDGQLTDGERGWVRVMSPTTLTTLDRLQAVPASMVMEDGFVPQPLPL
jgi:hypothetical protein